MVIMPVNGIDTGSSVNKYTSFGHKRNNTDDVPDVRENRGSNNLAKVPVVVLMAMSPAMLNANHPSAIEAETPAKTEMVAAPSKLDTEALDKLTAAYPGVDGLQQSDDGRSVVMKNKGFRDSYSIAHIESFTINGQKKYLVFASIKGTNNVVEIFIVPANNTKTTGSLPTMSRLFYHDLGEGKEFCSVLVYYDEGRKSDGKIHHVYRDERIPDDTANSIIDLLVGDTQYKDRTTIKVIRTKSAKLQAPFDRAF